MRNLIDRVLSVFCLPTFSERDDLERRLDIAQVFARQVAEAVADKAVVVGSDDVALRNLMLDRTVLIVPGVRRTLIDGCCWLRERSDPQSASIPAPEKVKP